MLNKSVLKVSALSAFVFTQMVGCGSDSKTPPVVSNPDVTERDFSTSYFDQNSTVVSNPYFPLEPGQSFVYEGNDDEGTLVRVEAIVSHLTRTVDGVESAILLVRKFEFDAANNMEKELVEETFDWFAQDMDGNVWYMGEEVFNYSDGVFDNQNGSWESGKDIDGVGVVAKAGIQMKADLVVGDEYKQEIYPGVADDTARIESLDTPYSLPNTTVSALQTLEWNPLEPDAIEEYKYYVAGTGLVAEEAVDNSEKITLIEQGDQKTPDIAASDFSNPRLITNPYFPLQEGDVREYEVYEEDELIETITIEVLSLADEKGDKTVNGVQAMVQRDRVRDVDGKIIEDTYDWFAQDDDGNVWYLGEEVTNYVYDDNDVLIETNSGGSFEWGVDGAQLGMYMMADPQVGDSYRQEYYEGEAEDIAAILELSKSITVNGTTYSTLVTEDWNPLDTESPREIKYYAQGIGVVREEAVDGSEYVILVSQ